MKNLANYSDLLEHLEMMIRALREFIFDQNKEVLEDVMSSMKKSLEFNEIAIDHLHLALYTFQEAVNTVLRSHNIKPHWMFALDNLVKNAVQAGITVLSPELGADLIAQDKLENIDEANEELSASATANSMKFKEANCDRKCLTAQLSDLKDENFHLIQDLLETHKLFQALLKSTLEEQRQNTDFVRNLSSQSSSSSTLNSTNKLSKEQETNIRQSIKFQNPVDTINNNVGVQLESINEHNKHHPIPLVNLNNDVTDSSSNTKLAEWLIGHNIDTRSRSIILSEQFKYDDFVYATDKDDIRRLGLKCGVEVSLWQKILQHRLNNSRGNLDEQ